MLATARFAATKLSLGISGPATVTVCIIGRDNEGTIAACLESIRRWVNQIVFVDTGSVDRTPLIAAAAGAEVHHFPWIDDFAAARNESLRHARGDWVFWMDTDDSIDEVNGAKLRALVTGPPAPDVVAYVLQVHCPRPTCDGGQEVTVVDHVKLFRNLPELRFEGRIHEQILPSIRRHGGQDAWTDIFVVHSGADHSLEGRQRKLERDLRILHQDILERPEHPFVLFNLGMTYADAGQHGEAADYLRRSVAVAQLGETHLRKAYALLISSLTTLQEFAEAEQVCRRGRELFPHDAEILFRQALLAQEQQQWDAAVTSYRQVLRVRDEPHFSSQVEGIQGYRARHNMALALEAQHRPELAEIQWRSIIRERPAYRPAWRALGQNLLSRGRWVSLEVLAEQASRNPNLDGETLVMTGYLHWARGEQDAALRDFQFAEQRRPDSVEVWRALGHFLYVHGDLAEAEAAVGHLAELEPTDGAAWHNLGLLRIRQGRHAEARAALLQSLAVRPGDVPTTRDLAALEMNTTSGAAEAAPAGVSTKLVNLPIVVDPAQYLAPCHSRRAFDVAAQRFYCAHPRVGTARGLVSGEFCRVCSLPPQPPPERFRETPPQASSARVQSTCRYLGDQVGERECASCRGKVRQKVFACRHSGHGETTWQECEQCPDRTPVADFV